MAQTRKQTEQEIDDLVEEWHTREGLDDISLHEFLGWTKYQYKKYLEENIVPEIIVKE